MSDPTAEQIWKIAADDLIDRKQIIHLLERIADALEHMDETQSRAAALEEWRNGDGKHPDD